MSSQCSRGILKSANDERTIIIVGSYDRAQGDAPGSIDLANIIFID